jgi:hypothetical protein
MPEVQYPDPIYLSQAAMPRPDLCAVHLSGRHCTEKLLLHEKSQWIAVGSAPAS